MAKEVGQVFGGIGDAVSGVLKGVGDAVDGAVKGVGDVAKQIWESPISRAILIAGAVYFGGAALAGGFGTIGTEASFLQGMTAGVGNAAASLSSAWGSAWSGELGEAGSTLGHSWGSAYDAGANTGAIADKMILGGAEGAGSNVAAFNADQVAAANGAAPPGTSYQGQFGYGPGGSTAVSAPPVTAPPVTAPPVTAPPVTAPPVAPLSDAQIAANQAGTSQYAAINSLNAPPAVPPTAPAQPWYSKALEYVTPQSELAKYGLISGATQMAGHVIAGLGQEQAAREQREYEAAQLQKAQDLRNANMSGQLWAPNQYAAAPVAPGLARRYMAPPYYVA